MIKKNFRIMAGGYKMVTFHTIEGALEDLKRGKIMMKIEKMKETLFVQHNLLQQKI